MGGSEKYPGKKSDPWAGDAGSARAPMGIEFEDGVVKRNTDRAYEWTTDYRSRQVGADHELSHALDLIEKARDEGAIKPSEAVVLMCGSGGSTEREFRENEESRVKLWEKLATEHKDIRKALNAIRSMESRAEKNQASGYRNSKKFYRGTNIAELKQIMGDGGAGNYAAKYTSLSFSESAAAYFASGMFTIHGGVRHDGVMLAYDGDAVRNTGVASPVTYLFQDTSDRNEIGATVPVEWHAQGEIRMPGRIKGLEITDVVMTYKAALDNLKLVERVKEQGASLAVITEWKAASLGCA